MALFSQEPSIFNFGHCFRGNSLELEGTQTLQIAPPLPQYGCFYEDDNKIGEKHIAKALKVNFPKLTHIILSSWVNNQTATIWEMPGVAWLVG